VTLCKYRQADLLLQADIQLAPDIRSFHGHRDDDRGVRVRYGRLDGITRVLHDLGERRVAHFSHGPHVIPALAGEMETRRGSVQKADCPARLDRGDLDGLANSQPVRVDPVPALQLLVPGVHPPAKLGPAALFRELGYPGHGGPDPAAPGNYFICLLPPSGEQGDSLRIEVGMLEGSEVILQVGAIPGECFHEKTEASVFQRDFSARIDSHDPVVFVVSRVSETPVLLSEIEPENTRLAILDDTGGEMGIVAADRGYDAIVTEMPPAVHSHANRIYLEILEREEILVTGIT